MFVPGIQEFLLPDAQPDGLVSNILRLQSGIERDQSAVAIVLAVAYGPVHTEHRAGQHGVTWYHRTAVSPVGLSAMVAAGKLSETETGRKLQLFPIL